MTASETAPAVNALVLFDIDGTLIRRAGPHHRQALVEAVRQVGGLESTTEGIPVQGMLDRDILRMMMLAAGASEADVRRAMPDLVRIAQEAYIGMCPALEQAVCPGVRDLLEALATRCVPVGLVTGNLTAIGWRKMERAGLRPYFRFGAFSEMADDRAGLARIAIDHARSQQWISNGAAVSLIGDHPNDIRAARANGIRAIAVGTGVEPIAALEACAPDLLIDDMRSLKVDQLLR
jgi:phosphoglycolate phosphatase-like HAD superfamily hydrolase